MEERERGPIESRLYEQIRRQAAGRPAMLDINVSGEMPPIEQRMTNAERMDFVTVEALLDLAREVDDLARRF